MMKKLKLIVTFVMFLSIFGMSPKAKEVDTLYVKTESSSTYDEYVSDKFDKLLVAQLDIEDFNNIFLGVGIKVLLPEEDYEYYVYPVILEDTIIATIHVSENDGEFGATYTKALSNELEELKSRTSPKNPMTLIRQAGILYAEIANDRILFENHNMNLNQMKSSNSLDKLPKVDTSSLEIKDVYSHLVSNEVSSLSVPRASSRVLPWTIYETQPNGQPWCASVTASNVIRNCTNFSSSSAQIRNWLNDYDGLTNAQVFEYIYKGLGIKTVVRLNLGMLPQSTVSDEINNSRAIYAGFKSGSDGHALAIFGYSDYSDVYYLHNPWYPYTETKIRGNAYVAGGYSWSWLGGAVYGI